MEAERRHFPLGGGGPPVQCGPLRLGGTWALSPFKEICESRCCVRAGDKAHFRKSDGVACLVQQLSMCLLLFLGWEHQVPGSHVAHPCPPAPLGG